ncbi:LOW QUALITY PROTEIN: UDP-glucosyltransferase 2-like [Lepeophtheirus salmonis]|uniref:LOW QUALITY PROTEIN: UDP-glucosyltransferase 2-like n=1 Tax=Lepeophtheirus salmonis TaxID=72036 RepID=UPI003AF39DD1
MVLSRDIGLIFLFVIFSSQVHGGKVLFFFPILPKSMLITFTPLAGKLRDNGHEVTIVAPFISGLKNVTEIQCDKEGRLKSLMDKISEINLQSGSYAISGFFEAPSVFYKVAHDCMKSKEIQALLEDKSTEFDAVVSAPIYADAAGIYLAHRFKASSVMYLSIQASLPTLDHFMNQPHNPSYMQSIFSPYQTDMNFIQRTGNVFLSYLTRCLFEWGFIAYTESLLDDTLPEPKDIYRPKIIDLMKNTSLTFHFGHPLLLDGNKAIAQNTIYLGMMNCQEPDFNKNMDPDIKKFIDEAEYGVVYVSFGTFLQSSLMSEEYRQIFIKAFSKLKQRVIWKWETEVMEDTPTNLLLKKWLPQKEILAHPNLKLFVSHAGQSSFQETLCFQKPALFIPVQGDQRQNAYEGVKKGMGLVIPYQELREDNFLSSMESLLQNSNYTQNAQHWGALVMDQINRPLDRAVWWMEYVIRHKPCHHFVQPFHKLNFIQRNLIDVYGFLTLILGLIIYVNFKIIQCCIHRCSRRRQKSVNTKVKAQ